MVYEICINTSKYNIHFMILNQFIVCEYCEHNTITKTSPPISRPARSDPGLSCYPFILYNL